MNVIRFEERDLRPYARPVSSEQLKQGEMYFSIVYADQDMLVPTVETLVFAGRNLSGEDEGKVYFQDFQSFKQGIRHSSPETDYARFQVGSENMINHIFEFDRALEELMKCSLRRREKLKQIP